MGTQAMSDSEKRSERATGTITPGQLKKLDATASKLGRTRSDLVSRYIVEGIEGDRKMTKLVGAPGMNQVLRLITAASTSGQERANLLGLFRHLGETWWEHEKSQGKLPFTEPKEAKPIRDREAIEGGTTARGIS
jgi:hypothetical protein